MKLEGAQRDTNIVGNTRKIERRKSTNRTEEHTFKDYREIIDIENSR